MTSPTGKGSGFISRNNDDQIAEAVFYFLVQAGIDRKRTVLRNVIPGWNGTIRTTANELMDGVGELQDLLQLLPQLKTVVLVGRKAQRALTHLSTDLRFSRPRIHLPKPVLSIVPSGMQFPVNGRRLRHGVEV